MTHRQVWNRGEQVRHSPKHKNLRGTKKLCESHVSMPCFQTPKINTKRRQQQLRLLISSSGRMSTALGQSQGASPAQLPHQPPAAEASDVPELHCPWTFLLSFRIVRTLRSDHHAPSSQVRVGGGAPRRTRPCVPYVNEGGLQARVREKDILRRQLGKVLGGL